MNISGLLNFIKIYQKIKSYYLFLGWLLIISTLSLYNGQTTAPLLHFDNFDKLIHVLLYSPASFLFLYSYQRPHIKQPIDINVILNIIIFNTLFGGFLELMQEYFCLNRDGNGADFLANVFGVLLGVSTFFLIKSYYNTKH